MAPVVNPNDCLRGIVGEQQLAHLQIYYPTLQKGDVILCYEGFMQNVDDIGGAIRRLDKQNRGK